MIKITLIADEFSNFKKFEAKGHSGSQPSISCAAVTVLLRTVAETICSNDKIAAKFEAPKPGEMVLEIEAYKNSQRQWLIGIIDTLDCGLTRLSKEYPGDISVEYVSELDK